MDRRYRARAAIVAVVALTGLAIGGAATNAWTKPAPPSNDQAAFDRLLARQEDAWARHDGAAFAATFTSDGDVVTFNCDHLRTREGIAEGLQYYFDNFIEDTRLRRTNEHVRYITPDLVTIVRTSCQVASGETDCREGSLSVNTNVLIKQDGEWLQTSFQNTRVERLR
jgi:uncharacterized protein (TIGR02246 family)